MRLTVGMVAQAATYFAAARKSAPHQRVAVVFVQLRLVPTALGSVHRALSGSVKGSELVGWSQRACLTGTADGANLERLSMEKPRRERYEALVTRLEPSDPAN